MNIRFLLVMLAFFINSSYGERYSSESEWHKGNGSHSSPCDKYFDGSTTLSLPLSIKPIAVDLHKYDGKTCLVHSQAYVHNEPETAKTRSILEAQTTTEMLARKLEEHCTKQGVSIQFPGACNNIYNKSQLAWGCAVVHYKNNRILTIANTNQVSFLPRFTFTLDDFCVK